MSKKMLNSAFFKLGFSSAILGTICNLFPATALSAINKDTSAQKIESYLSSNESLNNLEKQAKILQRLESFNLEKDKYIKNYNELKTLTLNNICADSKTLNELENVKNLSDLYSKTLTVNIFDENNLDTSLKDILNIIISNNIENTSFSSNFDKINSNAKIKKEITTLLNYLNVTTEKSDDRQISILKKLNEIENLLNEKSINENSINTFFNAMKKAYQMLISKRISKLLIESKRENVINYLQKASKNRNLSANGTAGYYGVTAGITTNLHQSEGKAEKSFYEISIGGGLNLAIGYELGLGIDDLKAALGADVEILGDISSSTVFFSLEQFLDAQINPNIKDKSSAYLTSKNIEKLVMDRKNLNQTEKDLLSCFQNSIEFYLKAAKIVPTSVNLTWPKLTRSSVPVSISQKSLSGKNKAMAKLLSSSLDGSVSVSGKKIDQKINSSYIKILNDDCTPSLNLSIDEITNEFAEKNSICFSIKKDFEKLLLDDKNKTQKTLPILVSTVLADIRQYNSLLSILADKNNSKENLEKTKKSKTDLENRWLGKAKLKRTKNREKFLKTAIALSVYLRQFATDEEDIALFKQLYNELLHLVEMQNFSKNKNTSYDGFKTKKSYNEYSVSGSSSVNVFDIANAAINVKYIKTEDEPGYGDGENIIISMDIPFLDTALSGVDKVKKALKKMHSNTPKNEFNIEETFITASKLLDKAVGFTGVPVALKIPGFSASTNGYLNLTFEFDKINKSKSPESIVPINTQEIAINQKNSWVTKCIKASSVSNLNAKLGGDVNIEAAKLGGKVAINDNYIKGEKFKLGTKCLSFPISRFNVSSLCSKDTNIAPNENYLWKSFTNSNKKDLYKLFLNIAKKDSIAYYQVQSIYNDIILENKNTDANESYKNTFEEFIDSCKLLKSLDHFDEETYNKTLSLFEKVLIDNFNLNFEKKLNRGWTLDSKNQKIVINY